MKTVFYSLLMLTVGCFTDEQTFEIKTVHVGDDVKFSCPRRGSGSIFWIKFGSGNFPEILGKTFRSEFVRHRIRVETEPGTFVLYISKAKLSDSAVYYCVKILQQNITFLNRTNLRVEEPAVTAVPPSDPVPPGDSVTLQCSILHDSEKKTCPSEDSMFCCAESHQSHPSRFIYTQDNKRDENEGNSTKKCFYGYFKNVSSSDARTCRCAVVACGEIIIGNKSSELNTQDALESKKINTALCLLCAALALCLLVVAFVIYSIKKLKQESYVYSDDTAAVALQTNSPVSGIQDNEQTDEESLVYSAPTFISRKSAKTVKRTTKAAEEESIYTDVNTLGLTS